MEASAREAEESRQEENDSKDQPMEGLDILAQAGVAAKTVELIGQVMRNYYGSLKIGTKVELGEEAINL